MADPRNGPGFPLSDRNADFSIGTVRNADAC